MPLVCLKQDEQDLQDGQDEEAKVWKTLMSIEPQQKQGEKVREDLNRSRLKQDGQDGQDGQDEQDEGAIAGAR